jgi:predicted ATPase
VPLTPLLGREREEAAVTALLRRAPQEGAGATVRLLTLTGPGGVGKTRLALQVAAGLREVFADGVVLVELAAVRDPSLLPSAIAQALGLHERGGQPLGEILTASLHDKHLLLLLDSFEHLLEAAPLVADLLRVCEGLTVLVTSRAALRVRGEQEFSVPPLALPDPTHLPPADALAQYPAVALFLRRTQAVLPAFALTPANAAAVAAICHRLDGLPLAIELAAARSKLLSPGALLARLEHRLQVLVGGPRDLPARQQTLRDTLAWSYELLDMAEQMLLRRLATFVGGCTLEAAEAVCSASGDLGGGVLEGLAALVDKSLLRQDAQADPHAGNLEPRVVMLETIREYAWERLTASGEAEALRRRHAAYFLALAESAEPALLGPDQAVWLARLESEHDNARAVLRWAVESAEFEHGLRLAGALWRFWQVRGHLSEGVRWLETLLARDEAGGRRVAAPVRARALKGAGVLAYRQGDYGQAATWLEESLALQRDLGNPEGIAAALNNLGLVAYDLGDYARAAALHAESLALRREVGDTWGSAISLNNLGLVARRQSDYGRARALFEESLALHRELGDEGGSTLALLNLGDVARIQGDHERALGLLEESLALTRQLGDTGHQALALLILGAVAREQGSYGRAAAWLEESLALTRQAGNKGGSALALITLGLVARAQGDYGRAQALSSEGLALTRQLGDRWGSAYALLSLGMLTRERGDYERATSLYAESLMLFQTLGEKGGLIGCLEGVAGVLGLQGQPARAARLLGAAAALRRALGAPLPPADRASHDRTVAAVRRALGEDAWATAWAAGQACTLEQAIATAL